MFVLSIRSIVSHVNQSRDGFISALSALPDRILLLALDLKRADYDRLALQLALTTAEINFTEQRQAFLSSMHNQNDGALAVGGECLDILEQVLAYVALRNTQAIRSTIGTPVWKNLLC